MRCRPATSTAFPRRATPVRGSAPCSGPGPPPAADAPATWCFPPRGDDTPSPWPRCTRAPRCACGWCAPTCRSPRRHASCMGSGPAPSRRWMRAMSAWSTPDRVQAGCPCGRSRRYAGDPDPYRPAARGRMPPHHAHALRRDGAPAPRPCAGRDRLAWWPGVVMDMAVMADDLRARGGGSAVTVRRVGIVVGVLLMGGLALLLQQDRQARIDAAYRQSLALATGADRLLLYGLRNLERALEGIADDAATWDTAVPEQRDMLLDAAIEGVTSRQPELHSIVLVDAQGNALSDGIGDPEFRQWRAQAGDGSGLLVGPLAPDGDGGWWLKLAVRHAPGRWLLARLRTTELDRMIRDLDSGSGGHVTVLDASGVLLARAPVGRRGPFVGQRAPFPAS